MGRWMIYWGGLSLAVLAVMLSIVACSSDKKKAGEDRPGIEVIGGGGTVSVSAAGAPGEESGSALYVPASDQKLTLAMAADLRDMRALMAVAGQGNPVDWAAVTAIYQNGKNQVRPDGSTRSLASQATPEVAAVFADGPSVYGRPNFVDAIIRDGLAGTGRGAGLMDNSRRQIVDRGVQMLFYGEALRQVSLASAATRPADARAALDQAWATLAGVADDNKNRNNGILATAAVREIDFEMPGAIARPLEAALSAATVGAEAGDRAGFDKAIGSARGYLNAVFYLSVLRNAKLAASDDRVSEREAHLADGWAFFQSIRAQVAAAAPAAAATIESAFERPATAEFPDATAAGVSTALNQAAVLQALAIPSGIQVK